MAANKEGILQLNGRYRRAMMLGVLITLALIASVVIYLLLAQPAPTIGKAVPAIPHLAATHGATATAAADRIASTTPTPLVGLREALARIPTPDLALQNGQGSSGATEVGYTRYYTETGHSVSGDFLTYYNNVPGAADLFGLPLTQEFSEQLSDGSVAKAQYFERARFEYHADPIPHVQLAILTPQILNGRSFDRVTPVSSTKSRLYFPESGHTLSGGFLEFWKANGALLVFGYPLSEEVVEDRITVQYFERARFEYHQDLAGTPYRIQLSPVGYFALKDDLLGSYDLPAATLIRFNPPLVSEGHTAEITVNASAAVTVTGTYEGRPLLFQYDPARGLAWSLIGAVPFKDIGVHQVNIKVENSSGGRYAVSRNLQVISYPYSSESLQFDPETAMLLASDTVLQEQAKLDKIFSGRSPQQYWSGAFRMPLDGQVFITSNFGTRRCYNCPNGSAPTTFHSGLDMAAEVGTPVRASANGVVVFAEALLDRGKTLVIDHGLGVYTLYAHNSRIIAQVGQHVQEGDAISLSGNTGLSTGPHLHWEMHVSGPAVDPSEWVRRAIP